MSKFTISNDYLQAEIEIPDSSYKRSRFDRMGMITSVTLNNKHTFAGVESEIEGQGSGGCGFFNEFGIEEAIGYPETEIGDQFLKIGVGLLSRDNNEAYDFFRDYEVEALDIDVNHSHNKVVIKSVSKPVNGYSVSYSKQISLKDNCMNIHYYLENLGSKRIETTEYCHNFVAINKHMIGPDYVVKFSFPVSVYDELGIFKVNSDSITWDKVVEKVLYTRFNNLPSGEENSVEILHKTSGIGVKESVDFKLHKAALWGMPHVISPELFKKIELEPKEVEEWNRTYTFFDK